jgi:hypothetical protein
VPHNARTPVKASTPNRIAPALPTTTSSQNPTKRAALPTKVMATKAENVKKVSTAGALKAKNKVTAEVDKGLARASSMYCSAKGCSCSPALRGRQSVFRGANAAHSTLFCCKYSS